MVHEVQAAGIARRDALRALGVGAVAALAAPATAQARRAAVALPGATHPALRLVQDSPEASLAVPVFDRDHAALLRAVFEAPEFVATLDGPVGAPPARIATGFTPNLADFRRVREAFFQLSNPRLTVQQREQLLPDEDVAVLFGDINLNDAASPVILRGTDAVDILAYWLMVAVDMSRPGQPATLAEGDIFTALRAQVLHGFVAAPSLRALSEQGRHDLTTWLFLNVNFMAVKMEFVGRDNNNDRSSSAEAAIRTDIQAALRGLGLEPEGLTLDQAGLRRARQFPSLAVPAFDADRAALLHALFTGTAFQATLTGGAGAAPAAINTRFGLDLPRLRQARDAFFDLVGPGLTAAERSELAPDELLPEAFADMPVGEATPPVVRRGTDVVDMLAQWLSLAVAFAQPPTAPEPDNARLFTAVRAQVAAGYAGTPALARLDVHGRHDLAAWLSMNTSYMVLTMTMGAFAGAGSGVASAEAALQARLVATLRDFRLDVSALTLDRRGLRRAG